jgi:hypothetical protein
MSLAEREPAIAVRIDGHPLHQRVEPAAQRLFIEGERGLAVQVSEGYRAGIHSIVERGAGPSGRYWPLPE